MVAHVKHERLATKALRDRGGELRSKTGIDWAS